MTRNFDRPAIMRVLAVKTKPRKDAVDNGIRDRGSEKSLDPFPAKCGSYRRPPSRVHVDHIAVHGSTGQVLDQSGCTIARQARHLDIGATFEAIRCFRGKT